MKIFLVLINFTLSVFPFMNHAFDLKDQRTFCFAPRSRSFSSVFSKSFMVFTFKSILSSFFLRYETWAWNAF